MFTPQDTAGQATRASVSRHVLLGAGGRGAGGAATPSSHLLRPLSPLLFPSLLPPSLRQHTGSRDQRRGALTHGRDCQLAPGFWCFPPKSPPAHGASKGPGGGGREVSVIFPQARLLPGWNFFEVFCFILKHYRDSIFCSKIYPCLFEY